MTFASTVGEGQATFTIPPGPRGNPLWGSMRDFQRDSLAFIRDVTVYGDVVRYRMATMWWYQINHPDGVRRILQENNRNYPKSSLTHSILKPLIGEGLFTSEGETWLRQRRLMQPSFHRRSITAFGALMSETTLAMLDRWEPKAASGATVDVSAEMTRLALDVVTAALFHAHLGDEPEVIARAIGVLVEEVNYRYQVPFYPPMSVPTARNRRLKAARETLDRAVYRIIEERRRDGGGEDLLSLLMHARDEETGEVMSDRQLRDEVITLLIAGHETTANTLSWSFYLLASHPEAERRLREESEGALGTGAARRPPSLADLSLLPFARMVLDEAMRLYPPAWITDRQATSEDSVSGHRIPAGTTVVICPYVLHRHPDLWTQPDAFDPYRFSPERSAGRPRYAYFPFGGGPRQCIGRDMALAEAHLILTTVTQRFRLRLAGGAPVVPQPLVTLRPRDGLPMILEKT